jgi:hypothetical protein
VINIVIDVLEQEMAVSSVVLCIYLSDAIANFRGVTMIAMHRDICVLVHTDVYGFVVYLTEL